ncbi:extracellular solute-binding protein [Cellulomonas citrea]|uniref:extracellular solute-binding protein n=1 Tax=Cellulomonas citrea TaxID=1909423 RepID=UPI00135B2524|nr:extracellular solute-binding protein [Cellulomonas citrea]
MFLTRRTTLSALGACAVAALALSACSSGNAGSTQSALSTPGASISGTVTFWHAYSADSNEAKTLDTVLIPKFESEHPGVTVNAVAVPYDDLHQKLVTAVAGDTLPDLVRSDIMWVPELADLGVLVPLDQQMPDFTSYSNQVYPGALATNAWKGHYYGLPLDTNTRVMLYNSDALAKAGLTKPPATFADLRADAPALTAAGVSTFADNSTSGWNVLPWIWSAGGSVTDDKVTKATGYLNSPASVAGVQLLVDLYKEKAIPDTILGGTGGTATSDGLATGAYATILDGPWMYPIFASQYPNFQVKAAPVPAGDGGSISVVGGESVVLTQSSKNKDAATEFLRFLLSQDAQTEMAKVGQMSVLTSLGDQLTKINPYYSTFVDQLATARPRTPTPAWPKIDDILKAQIQKALQGDLTVQAALDEAAAQIDPLLAKYAG